MRALIILHAAAGFAPLMRHAPPMRSLARRHGATALVTDDDHLASELSSAESAVSSAESTAIPSLWAERATLLGITACWGANFPVTTYALRELGGGAEDGALFVAARFLVGTATLAPFLASASCAGSVRAGVSVGALCALGYASQAVALGLGTSSGTAAFICSLQSVVVALMAARASRGGGGGGVPARTWAAVALSVAGVGCLELPGVLSGGGGAFCLGDVVALGQPLGFGYSYVVLERAMEEHPEDSLPLSALQCLVIAAASVAAASAASHALPWDLHWEHLAGHSEHLAGHWEHLAGAAPDAGGPAWAVPAAIAYTGVVSTGLTIFLTARVFKVLPAIDASVILSSEPLWATGFAALLLGDGVDGWGGLGGVLILAALAINQGLLELPRGPQPAVDEPATDA